jgi:hypothetical protein
VQSFTRRSVAVALSLAIINTQASWVVTPPSRYSLTAPVSEWFSLASWHSRRYFRNLFRPQSSPNLDTLRSSTPSLPDPPGGTNVTPPTNYDDPKAASTAANLSPLSLSLHDTGIAGSKPLQNADPTTGASVTGVSFNLDSRNFTFTAPVLSLAGRAGLNLSLALTYNSKILNSIGGAQASIPTGDSRLRAGDSSALFRALTTVAASALISVPRPANRAFFTSRLTGRGTNWLTIPLRVCMRVMTVRISTSIPRQK